MRPELTSPTNEQLQAELEQQELDRQALKKVSQHLAEEENAQQQEARERILYRNANEKLATQLRNYKSVLSTLQERDETGNLSAHIAADPNGPEFATGEEEEEGEEENGADDLVLGPRTVYYSTQDVEELHQEWQDTHQQEMIDLQ